MTARPISSAELEPVLLVEVRKTVTPEGVWKPLQRFTMMP